MTTSRIGRKPIAIPAGIEVTIANLELTAKGPKGKMTMPVHPFVKIEKENNEIKIVLANKREAKVDAAQRKLYRSIAGTTRANLSNIIHGVSQGFERKLLLVGVGYRAQVQGKVLNLSIGLSHPSPFAIPEGIVIETPTQTEIIIKGMDKKIVGLVAAKIRAYRPPEPYKGKGIRYADEVIELKETKKK